MIRSIPIGLPEVYFFRHGAMNKGIKPGSQFGPKYFRVWWIQACKNLGIEGVDLYGGTKHSTTVGLGKVLSPEQIRRGGTGHKTNKAFERYLMPDKTEGLLVTKALKELREQVRGEVIPIDKTGKK